MNYHPSAWERIGGPWAITLRAFLWTSPLAILLQPIIEPGFWSGENYFIWISVCTAGYLAFGLFLYIAAKFLIPNRDVKPAPVVAILLIAVFGGFIRSFVIGSLIPVAGLSGIGPFERMPFGAVISVFWIVTAALIMDAKYRYRKQLDELVAEQIPLLQQQKSYLANFAQTIPAGTKTDFDMANFHLQNAFGELAIKTSTAGSEWQPISNQAYRSIMNLIFVQVRPRRFTELSEEEYISSPSDAFKIISRTPLFHIPVVISFYVTSIFLALARIVPIEEAAISLSAGLLVNLLILVIGKKVIQRSGGNSSFGYLAMFAILTLLAIIGPLFSSATYISVFELQTFALAGTVIEIIWIIATGVLLLSQQNRQKIIDQATMENELLQKEIQYWETVSQRVAAENYSPSATLELMSSDLRSFLKADQPENCKGAIECASSLVAEIKFVRGSIDEFSIEDEFERIVSTWGQEVDILWTVSGEIGSESTIRRAITLIEISILKSLRNGDASVISIDVTNSNNISEVTITDNGIEHSNTGTSLGVEVIQTISNNSWSQIRAGGVNKVTATVG